MVIQTATNTSTGSGYRTREWLTHVLNETTGETIQIFKRKGSTSTPLVHDGKIFIANREDSQIWAYTLETGEELWHTTSLLDSSHIGSYCSPALTDGTIYYQTYAGIFYAISEAKGETLWTASLGGLGFGSPSIGNGCVFITNDACLYAFKINSETGEWPMFCHDNLHRSHT
jgi:outer membrane protein assembly factor BamB